LTIGISISFEAISFLLIWIIGFFLKLLLVYLPVAISKFQPFRGQNPFLPSKDNLPIE